MFSKIIAKYNCYNFKYYLMCLNDLKKLCFVYYYFFLVISNFFFYIFLAWNVIFQEYQNGSQGTNGKNR